MEYHFLKPKAKASEPRINTKNILKVLGRFLPVFVLAAALPFLIGFVAAPPDISFLTRADEAQELRVWLEPANVILRPGSSTELSVVAQFDGDGKLIPEISLSIVSEGGVTLENENITHSIPFSGRAEIGKVTVRAASVGQAVVSIPKENILITAFEGPLEVSVGKANIIVRQ